MKIRHIKCFKKYSIRGLSTSSALKVPLDFSSQWHTCFDIYFIIHSDQPNYFKVSKQHIGHMKYVYTNIKEKLCFIRLLDVQSQRYISFKPFF